MGKGYNSRGGHFGYSDNVLEAQAQKYWNTSRAWRGLRQPDNTIRALVDVLTNIHHLRGTTSQKIAIRTEYLSDMVIRKEPLENGKASA